MRKLFRLLVFILMGLVALAGMLTLLWYVGWLSFLTTRWKSLSEESRQLIQFGAVLIAILVAYLQLRAARHPTIIKDERRFPFELFSTQNIGSLKKRFLGPYSGLNYQPRFLPPR